MDRLSADFAQELEAVLTLLTARIKSLIRELDTGANGRLVATRANLRRAVRLRNDILAQLQKAGFVQLAEKATNAPLDLLAERVLRSEDSALEAFDVDVVAALKQIRLADVLQVGEDMATTLWRTTVDGVLGLRPVLDLVDDISDLLDISAKRARTIYDTAVSTFSRQMAQLGATGEPDEPFIYVGPVDERIREFCLEHVGKVYTRDRIDDMDNGQLPNVFLTGGGYNCRHVWRKVSPLDTELLGLVNTGEVEAGVQARLEDSQLAGAGA